MDKVGAPTEIKPIELAAAHFKIDRGKNSTGPSQAASGRKANQLLKGVNDDQLFLDTLPRPIEEQKTQTDRMNAPLVKKQDLPSVVRPRQGSILSTSTNTNQRRLGKVGF